MRRRLALAFAVSAVALTAFPPVATAQKTRAEQNALKAAIAAPARSEANRARDKYRHPYETLSFFGVRPNATVVEIWPGGGWYTEILGPYLKAGGGKLIVATMDGKPGGGVTKLQQADAATYGGIDVVTFPAFDTAATRLPAGTADAVLTFRNVHNWRMGSRREDKADYSAEAFRQMYVMLKPGGVLGIEEHRLPEKADAERERKSGYMKVSTVRRLAEQAGFRYAGASEVNANPRDSADWPDGVWTLPPSYALKDKDRAKYAAIGESDRMTLKFVKPR